MGHVLVCTTFSEWLHDRFNPFMLRVLITSDRFGSEISHFISAVIYKNDCHIYDILQHFTKLSDLCISKNSTSIYIVFESFQNKIRIKHMLQDILKQ